MKRPESAFYQRIAELLAQGKRFTVCRVVRAVGSVPRNVGAQMLVFPDGSIEFTLGGGAVEGRVIREAALASDTHKSFVKDYHLGDLGMHCGGIMGVQFEPASVDDLDYYKRAAELYQLRQPFVAVYAAADARQKALFPLDGIPFGDSGLIEKHAAHIEQFWDRATPQALDENTFVHRVLPKLRVLIFGAGHVGAKLAEVAAATGVFHIEITDDRKAFADAKTLAFCDRVVLAPHNYEGDLPLPDERTFVAVITRCHDTDKMVLKTLLRSDKPFAYLGMIGSVPKRARLFKMLKDEGLTAERLDRITTPMGLPIGGKEPGEIAVSMLAEMIQIKNKLDDSIEGGNARWRQAQTVS